MFRWIMLVLAVLGLALVFTTKSPAVLGLALLSSLVGVVGFIFSLAADRIASNARPDTAMASVEELAALGRRHGAARRSAPVGGAQVLTERGDDGGR
jgi:hypothetical protein